ncbi:unnamed protein product [Allacma fusca]|uniref:Uncharacterized protein n=1 Tax=Allacma fusca TaxID=39272 RepID=A0A8J2LNF1_9HEXA|nr:unnamed protein product [Allacma fusca]
MLKRYRISRNDIIIDTAFRIGKVGPKPRPIKIRLLYQSDADHILFKSKEKDSETRKAGIYVNEDVSVTEGKNRFLIRKEAQMAKQQGKTVETWRNTSAIIDGVIVEAKGGQIYRNGTEDPVPNRNF